MKAITWVKNHLGLQGIAYEHLCHAPGAEAGANGGHYDKGRLAKTVVVKADGRPIVLVIPGNRRLCMDRVLEQLGAKDVKLATDGDIKFHFPDCEPGAVPPMRHWNGSPLVIDPAIKVEGDIYFYAGTHHDVIRLGCDDWLKFVHPREAAVLAAAEPIEAHACKQAASAGGRPTFSPSELAGWLAELVDVLQLEAKELERLLEHVEQRTGPLTRTSQLSMCASELAELKNRLTSASASMETAKARIERVAVNAN